MLGQTLLDLARLLARVHVQRQPGVLGVAADRLEPVPRAGADGVGGDADASVRGEVFDLLEVRGDSRLPKAREPAARIGGMDEDELHLGVVRRLDRRQPGVVAQIVELADGRVARLAQLTVDGGVERAHGVGCLAGGLGEHRLAPGPEVTACLLPAQGALEAVRVNVDEAGEREPRHQTGSSARAAVSAAPVNAQST